MAITITSSPSNPAAAGSPFYFTFTSTNSTKLNFRFVVDVYQGYTPGSSPSTYVGRFSIPVRVGGGGIFSPASVLSSYVKTNLNPTANGFSSSNTSQSNYQLYIGESYDSNLSLSASTGVTIYSGLTTSSIGNVINAVKQYESTTPLSARTYQASTTVNLLTDWNASNAKKIRRGEYETIGIYKMQSNTIAVQTFDSASTQIGLFYLTNGYSSSIDRYQTGVGTANLNINATNQMNSSTEEILSSAVKYYVVSVCQNTIFSSINIFNVLK